MAASPAVLRPDWDAAVGALVSTREGGVSAGAWASMNLGLAVGDQPAAVAENRRRFGALTGAAGVVWLRQVHGSRVVRVGADDLRVPPGADPHEADAAWTDAPGVPIAIQVADCLPVLFAVPGGRAVAAAHAGWRGLAGGVLEQTVQALCQGSGCAPDLVQAWLGPCIGPAHFEVGADVLQAFAQDPSAPDPVRFLPRPRADGGRRWLADLPRLATDRLQAAGVQDVSGGRWCTFSDASRFFSYRRDGITGRLGAAIWCGPR